MLLWCSLLSTSKREIHSDKVPQSKGQEIPKSRGPKLMRPKSLQIQKARSPNIPKSQCPKVPHESHIVTSQKSQSRKVPKSLALKQTEIPAIMCVLFTSLSPQKRLHLMQTKQCLKTHKCKVVDNRECAGFIPQPGFP